MEGTGDTPEQGGNGKGREKAEMPNLTNPFAQVVQPPVGTNPFAPIPVGPLTPPPSMF